MAEKQPRKINPNDIVTHGQISNSQRAQDAAYDTARYHDLGDHNTEALRKFANITLRIKELSDAKAYNFPSQIFPFDADPDGYATGFKVIKPEEIDDYLQILGNMASNLYRFYFRKSPGAEAAVTDVKREVLNIVEFS